MEVSGHFHASAALPRGNNSSKHRRLGWVGLEVLEESLLPLPGFEPRRFVVAALTALCRIHDLCASGTWWSQAITHRTTNYAHGCVTPVTCSWR